MGGLIVFLCVVFGVICGVWGLGIAVYMAYAFVMTIRNRMNDN